MSEDFLIGIALIRQLFFFFFEGLKYLCINNLHSGIKSSVAELVPGCGFRKTVEDRNVEDKKWKSRGEESESSDECR